MHQLLGLGLLGGLLATELVLAGLGVLLDVGNL